MKRWLISSQFAKGGKFNKPEAGYTITELLIVLAATTMLISITVAAFSGRQSRVEFTQAVRTYEAYIQGVFNDISKGYYSSEGFSCSAPGDVISITPNPSSGTTGTNKDCVFMGKMITPAGLTTKVSDIVGVRNDTVEFHSNPVFLIDQGSVSNHDFQLRVDKIVGAEPQSGVYPEIDHIIFFGHHGFDPADIVTGSFSRGYGAAGSFDIDSSGGYYVVGSGLTQLAKSVDLGGFIMCITGQNDQKAEIRIGNKDSDTALFSELDTKPTPGGACAP